MSKLLALLLAILCILSLTTVIHADDTATDTLTDEELAAEEAAAAAVEEAAEEEDEDDADALDEEADSARLSPDKHPLTDLPPPAIDVEIAHAFSTGLEQSVITLGETVKTLIAFANSGRSTYHVWGVMGSLNNEKYSNIFVQNFTYGHVNKTVAPGGELSFSYSFTPNERLDTRPFRLALSVFYEAQGATGNAIRGHSTTFYNATLPTKPGAQSMSNSLFMLLFGLFLAAIGAAVYFLRETEQKKEPTVEMGTAPTDKNEWLEEHHTMARTGGGRVRSRAAGKK